MRSEHGVDEWLPGGIALGDTVPEGDGVEFTLEGAFGPQFRLQGGGPAAPPDREDLVDLNEVDFDGLIALGLPVGQAARFISQRERRGGIAELSELDAYYGLAPGVRDILRLSGHVK